jgi:hypothetical protein
MKKLLRCLAIGALPALCLWSCETSPKDLRAKGDDPIVRVSTTLLDQVIGLFVSSGFSLDDARAAGQAAVDQIQANRAAAGEDPDAPLTTMEWVLWMGGIGLTLLAGGKGIQILNKKKKMA